MRRNAFPIHTSLRFDGIQSAQPPCSLRVEILTRLMQLRQAAQAAGKAAKKRDGASSLVDCVAGPTYRRREARPNRPSQPGAGAAPHRHFVVPIDRPRPRGPLDPEP